MVLELRLPELLPLLELPFPPELLIPTTLWPLEPLLLDPTAPGPPLLELLPPKPVPLETLLLPEPEEDEEDVELDDVPSLVNDPESELTDTTADVGEPSKAPTLTSLKDMLNPLP